MVKKRIRCNRLKVPSQLARVLYAKINIINAVIAI